jgi:DNA-binding transcriptional LysR family regulator
MIDVDKLFTLRVVVSRGSFSAAAHALNLTQPAVSRQVSVLERRAGIQLVRRTQRGVYPTEAGEVLISHADAIASRLERAEADLAQLAGGERGTIRLGSFFTAMVYLSAEVSIALGDRHPGLIIVDDLVNRGEALARLARGQLDLAIVFEHDFEPAATPDGITTFALFDDPVRVLLPARHPLAGRSVLQLHELGGETWIRAHDGSAARHVDHLLGLGGLSPRVLLAGHGDEPVEAQALVAAGRGITIAYDLNVIINPDQIVSLRLNGDPSVRHIRAAHLPDQASPAVTAGIQALRRVAKHHQQQGA